MSKVSGKISIILQRVVGFSLAGFIFYGVLTIWMDSISVTSLNVTFGIITLVLSLPLGIAGVMANDSGKGGFVMGLLQFLLLSIPLVYLIGLVSSISVLYVEEFEGQQETAFWLASLSGFHLIAIIMFFGLWLLAEKLGFDV